MLKSLFTTAHTVVLSEYTLQYEEEHWILLFKQKTSHLRDAIYLSDPGLKGINLNGEVFLNATAKHIASNITLTNQGKPLQISPKRMKYGGLRFESTFVVEGLSKNPNYLTIQTAGFDAYEHSVMLFRTTIGDEGYLHYFNQEQKLATLDFKEHRYLTKEIESNGKNYFVFYVLSLLMACALVAGLLRKKLGLNTFYKNLP